MSRRRIDVQTTSVSKWKSSRIYTNNNFTWNLILLFWFALSILLILKNKIQINLVGEHSFKVNEKVLGAYPLSVQTWQKSDISWGRSRIISVKFEYK